MAHLIQKAAPLFSAEAVDKETFKIVSLENYRGKYVVLLFYPLDFTFVCPTELCSFSDRIDEFRALDCEVHFCDAPNDITCGVVRITNTTSQILRPDVFDIEYIVSVVFLFICLILATDICQLLFENSPIWSNQ